MDALEFLSQSGEDVLPLREDREFIDGAEKEPPSAFERFQHQVAGHAEFFFLHGRDRHVFKPENPLETATYRVMQHAIPSVAAFAPRCLGIARIAVHPKTAPKNVCAGFAKPCILDVKLGTRQHGLHVPLGKVLSKTTRCLQTTSSVAGLRICGIQVFDRATARMERRDKLYGRALRRGCLPEAVSLFLSGAEASLRQQIATSFVEQIRRLRAAVEQVRRHAHSPRSSADGARQANWRFWSCSLILVYDADWQPGVDCEARITLVDFAHTCILDHSLGPDEGMLLGLDSLAHLLV